MSNIYIQEPSTHGKVLLKTSLGDIDIELWSKEAPKACRNFVQLCMENYYDGTIFHRVMKDFIAQGGDPTGTGEGGESIYGKPFRDEIHSRLRFVRRGLVAMANAGKDDNGSQFFFSLGPTQELQGKHTIFGKVSGDTIYNVIKFNEVYTDDTDRPQDPPKIKKTEVLFNPFDDIIPREVIKHEKQDKKPKSKSKGKKDFKLLSFGEEAEEEEEALTEIVEKTRTKGKSAHELANDPKLSAQAGEIEESSAPQKREAEEELESVKKKLKAYDKTEKSNEDEKNEVKEKKPSSRTEELRVESRRLQRELNSSRNKKSEADETQLQQEDKNPVYEEYKREIKKFGDRKSKIGKKADHSREANTLAILDKFKKKISTVRTMQEKYGDDSEEEDEKSLTKGKSSSKEKKKVDNEEEEEESDDDPNDNSWLTHKLEFGDAHSKVLDANVTDIDRYEIFDPRNPMVKRRREEAKKDKRKQEKEQRKHIA